MSSDKPAISGRGHWLALILLVVVGLILRLYCLACKPFWFDECFSVEVSRIDWRNFLHLMWWREANMSLYYILLRIWLHFGSSPFFIRSLSALISAATIPAIYWLANLLFGRRVALISAALFAFNAYSVRFAQEARSYALFVLLATLSTGFLIAWLLKPNRHSWFGYVATSILSVYAHFYALLLIVVHWLTLRWKFSLGTKEPIRKFTELRELRRAWIAIGAGVSPLLIFVAKTGAGPIKWIQRPTVHDVFSFYKNLAGGNTWWLLACCVVACAVAVAPLIKQLSGTDASWEVWRGRFLLVWLIFPVALTVLLSFARPVFLARYMIFCLPALVILTASGTARLRSFWIVSAALAMFLVLSFQGILFVYAHDFDNERDASGEATNFVLDHSQAGDAIIFHIAETRIPYEFFRSLRASEDTASPDFNRVFGPEILFPYHGRGLDYRDFTGKPTAELVRSACPSRRRIWIMLMNNAPGGKPDPTTVMLTDGLRGVFPKITSWQFAKVELRLYSKE